MKLSNELPMIPVFILVNYRFFEHIKTLVSAKTIMDSYQFDIFHSVKDFSHLSILKYSIVIIYVNIRKIENNHYNKLKDFVKNGGSLLTLHASTNSFRNQPSSLDILGARFIRHGLIQKYKIHRIATSEIFSEEINELEIEDELFRQEYHPEIKIHYHYKGRSVVEPMVWSKTYGKGKILGIFPGHKVETFQNAHYRKIIQKSLKWLSRKP